ncbi:MAG: hypothetical protein WDA65_04585 [Christensenellales bacterium]
MKTNPFSKTFSITVISSDQPRKKPYSLVIRKYLFFMLCFVFTCASTVGVYAGISAYLSLGKLSKTVDGLTNILIAKLSCASAAAYQESAVIMSDEFDFESLAIVTGDEVQYSDSDSALMSDPWLEIESTANSFTIEMESGSKNGRVELLSWADISRDILARGTQIVVIDVDTGLSFNAKRHSGTFHSDTDPLTAKDTEIFKQIYGGRWSWDRHAVWVKIGDRYFAASMNGMPHANSHISGNGFKGHFCIHFMNSRVHETSKKCPVHQAMVVKAFSSADRLEEFLKNNQY